jgi:hypothetical protein
MASIKNPEAKHSLGVERFPNVPEIAQSTDAYAMCKAMWNILDESTNEPERVEIRLRVMTFLREHDMKRPR